MQSLSTRSPTINTAPPPPPVLQVLIVSGRALRLLKRHAGLRTPEPTATILGCGPSFPTVSSHDWHASCEPLPADVSDDLRQLPSITDFVRALLSVSFMIQVDGDAEDLETLHDL